MSTSASTPTVDFRALRVALAALPADVSSDAVGVGAPTLEDLYAPETHAAALDPGAPIVQGARGTGKSFWAGVLGDEELRMAAAKAYPKLGLERIDVQFGYTGIEGPGGIGREKLDSCVSADAGPRDASAFFWATILRALELHSKGTASRLKDLLTTALDLEAREEIIHSIDQKLSRSGKTLLIVYDALDTMATSWTRSRLLTQALLEVVWAMRAYRSIRLKLFVRPDQIEDDALRFVELPKLRTGAVRLTWADTDLYGLLFSRLALGEAKSDFQALLATLGLRTASREQILTRQWSLVSNSNRQKKVMTALAGPFMADGEHGYKKGNTYDWPLKHLADAFKEVTPRSFLGLMIAAAKHGPVPVQKAITPAGIYHGLRAASKTRVDQLHQEFLWIKGVLAPLAGLLLPQDEEAVFVVWRRAKTVKEAIDNAHREQYLPPFQSAEAAEERGLYDALERIGVMFRRKDGRIDMPDLFRVAARLLKKGGTAPL